MTPGFRSMVAFWLGGLNSTGSAVISTSSPFTGAGGLFFKGMSKYRKFGRWPKRGR